MWIDGGGNKHFVHNTIYAWCFKERHTDPTRQIGSTSRYISLPILPHKFLRNSCCFLRCTGKQDLEFRKTIPPCGGMGFIWHLVCPPNMLLDKCQVRVVLAVWTPLVLPIAQAGVPTFMPVWWSTSFLINSNAFLPKSANVGFYCLQLRALTDTYIM